MRVVERCKVFNFVSSYVRPGFCPECSRVAAREVTERAKVIGQKRQKELQARYAAKQAHEYGKPHDEALCDLCAANKSVETLEVHAGVPKGFLE